jgi:hypothetical protein
MKSELPSRAQLAKVAAAATIGSWVENYKFVIAGTLAGLVLSNLRTF